MKEHSTIRLDDVTVGLPQGLRLSVPYNFDRDLIAAIADVSDYISSVYLPFHPSVCISARAYNGPNDFDDYIRELSWLASALAPLDIGVSLLANAPAVRVNVDLLVETASLVRNELPSLRVTFADLMVAVAVHKKAPWLTIGTSCLANVDSQNRAQWWIEQAGASHVVVARDVNRRPDVIAAIHDLGVSIGMVDSDDCVPGCACVHRHFLPSMTADGRFVDMDPACDPHNVEIRKSRPWVLAQKEILPGNFQHLVPHVSELKITGRNLPTEEILRLTALALEARSLVHPRGYYEEPPEAWARITNCDRRCTRCGWCEKHILPFVAEETNDEEEEESFEEETSTEPIEDPIPECVLLARALMERLAGSDENALEGYEATGIALEQTGDDVPELKLELSRDEDVLTVFLRRRDQVERPLLHASQLALVHGGDGDLGERERGVAEQVLRAFDERLPTLLDE